MSMSEHGSRKDQTNEAEEGDFLLAMQLATVIVLPMVMQTSIELDLFEIIANVGPGVQVSTKHIASQLSTNNPNAPLVLDRILRVLASYSILTSSLVVHENIPIERVYGLTPVCKYFVRNEDGVSLSPLTLLSHDKVCMRSWSRLKDSVLNGGIPFNMAYGMHLFEYAMTDSRFNEVFNKAMFDLSTMFVNQMLQTYKGFEGIKEIIDVGGGLGRTVNKIVSYYPAIMGINFDLPHVIEQAPSYPGVKHVGGDMFDQVPNGETIFLKGILHDWCDEYCLKLLKNCYKALPTHGKLIIVDGIQPDAPESNSAAKSLCQLDLFMMAIPGGKERTEEEFRVLLTEAGFSRTKKACCIYNNWVIESYNTEYFALQYLV